MTVICPHCDKRIKLKCWDIIKAPCLFGYYRGVKCPDCNKYYWMPEIEEEENKKEMKHCSTFSMEQAVLDLENFCPVKIYVHDNVVFNDYDEEPVVSVPGWETQTCYGISIEIVDFHHSIIYLY